MEASDQKTLSHRFEQLIGCVLLGGVLLTSVFLAAGFLWQQKRGVIEEPVFLQTTFAALWAGSLAMVRHRALGPSTLTKLGLGLLLATPYTRVILSVFYFAVAERNWKYTFITLFVLTFLTYHLFFR
jgi:uncharacterized membrane protein